MRPKDKAAVSLGRRGGTARSTAKTKAARSNGAKGGRPVKTIDVGLRGLGSVTVHHDAVLVGYTVRNDPAFRAASPAAARWLKRHGYERSVWRLSEIFEEVEYCWA